MGYNSEYFDDKPNPQFIPAGLFSSQRRVNIVHAHRNWQSIIFNADTGNCFLLCLTVDHWVVTAAFGEPQTHKINTSTI